MPFFVLPDAGVSPVVQFIQEAQGPLVINNYFLDSRPVLAAIQRKVQQGEKVYLILEPKPFEIPQYLVSREFSEAAATGAYVVSPPPSFSTGDVFDHAKYAVASNEALIGTANWDASAFRKNREFLYTTAQGDVVRALQQVAVADLRQVQFTGPLPSEITLSPGAAPEISPVLSQPGPVSVEAEELQPNDPLFAALEQKGNQARVILPEGLSQSETQAVSALVVAGVQVREMPKTPIYIHAKLIVGDASGWIGSQNFSATSLNQNREVGIILNAPADLTTMQSVFNDDWSNSEAPED